jgi:flagellar protein FlaG
MRTHETQPVSAPATTGDTQRLAAIVPPDPVTPAAPAKGAEPVPAKPLPRDALEAIARGIQDYLQRNGRNLEFRVDDSTGETVITVRDASTGDVIRQIPNEEALAIAQRFSANSGTLFDQMV